MAYNPFSYFDEEERKKRIPPPVLRPFDTSQIVTEVPNVTLDELLGRATKPDTPKLQPIPMPDAQVSDAITLRPYEHQPENVYAEQDVLIPPDATVSSDIDYRRTPRLSLGSEALIQPPAPIAERSSGTPLANQAQRQSILARGGNPTDAILSRDPLTAETDRLDWLQNPANKVVNKPDEGKDSAGWKGRLKDALMGALFTAGQQVRANGGQAGWGTLGAAIGGGAGGAIRPQWNEELQRENDIALSQRRVGTLQNQAAFGMKQRAAGLDNLKAQTDITGKVIANQRAIGELELERFKNDPAVSATLQQIDQRKTVTADQAALLNAKLGKPVFQPGYWGGFEEVVDPATGKRLIRPKDDPRYLVNPTVSPDATQVPVGVQMNGIPLTLKPPQVAQAITAEAQANAQRTQAATIHNSNNALEVAKANASARQTYNNQVMQMTTQAITQLGQGLANLGEVQGAQNRMNNIGIDLQSTLGELLTIDPVVDAKAYAATQKRVDDLQKQFNAAEKDLHLAAGRTTAGAQLATQLMQLKGQIQQPQMVSAAPVAPVQTNIVSTGKVLSKAAVQKAAKENKVSYAEAERQAKAQGYTIQ